MRETIVTILAASALCFEIAVQPVGKISYQSSENWQIHIMDVESDERTKITHDMEKADMNASLSNEGSRIAMSADLDRDGDREIHIIDISSGRRWRLTNNPWNENHPRWSPDGKWIAFSKGNIYKIRHSDKLTVRITNDDSFSDTMPAFSPDEKKIAFVSCNLKGLGDALIYVVDLDTGKRRRLTETDGAWHVNPCWSPDGKHIAFHSTIPHSISIMDDDGDNERILIENAYYPSWSPCRPYAVLPHDRTSVPWGALKALWRTR